MTAARPCTVCGRPLTDPVSRLRGTGPVCERRTRRPTRQDVLSRPMTDVPTGPYL